MTTILTFEVTSDKLADEFADITFKYVWLVKNDDNSYAIYFGDVNDDTPEDYNTKSADCTLEEAVKIFHDIVKLATDGCKKSETI